MLGRFRKLLGSSEAEAEKPEKPAAEEAPEEETPLQAPTLEYVRFDEILTFRTSHLLPLHTAFETSFEEETLTLTPRTRASHNEITMEYTADVDASQAVLAALTERYGPEVEKRGGREERRAEPRHLHCIRVRSRHLPLFQGLTHDVSTSGLRLVVEGEVAAGTALQMDLQLDHIRLPDLRARGEIVWVRPKDGRSWWAGVRLLEVEGTSWGEYLAELEESIRGGGLTRKNFLDS